MSRTPASIHLEILSGSRTGTRLDFHPGRVPVGRAPESLLRFDPELDLDVSSRHAELVHDRDGWSVRDVGSTNGTLVNGVGITSSRRLSDGDEIRFGADGPRVRVHLSTAPAAGAAPSVSASPGALFQSGRGRWILMGLGALAVVAVSTVLVVQASNRAAWSEERDRLTGRIDSLRAREQALSGEMENALTVAADSIALAREEARRARARLQAAEGAPNPAELEELRRELQEATVSLQRLQLAASLDFDRFRREVEPTVAMIWSESDDGTVATGTAVAVAADGTLLTSRHVVAPVGRGPARRLAIQFAGSTQVWRAEVVDVHPSVDLAWVRTEGIVGDVPALNRLNARVDTLPVGAPVVIAGFPLGGGAGSTAEGVRRRAVVSAGVLLEQGPDGLRIQGYGAEGASGSPVLDQAGELIGILYGAMESSTSKVLLAVPVRYVLESSVRGAR